MLMNLRLLKDERYSIFMVQFIIYVNRATKFDKFNTRAHCQTSMRLVDS